MLERGWIAKPITDPAVNAAEPLVLQEFVRRTQRHILGTAQFARSAHYVPRHQTDMTKQLADLNSSSKEKFTSLSTQLNGSNEHK